MNRKLRLILSSRWFFIATVLLFGLSALWVAVTSLYPMAFDEDFHLGLIRIYALSWIPYGIEHTRDMATYGAATGDPSYLWHYLLSFPYRLMASIGWSEQAIVIALRLINLAVFLTSIVLYRAVLLRAGLSKHLTHTVLAFFLLIPVLPLLAGQINYDNPLMLLVAASFWYALRWRENLHASHSIPLRESIILIIIVLIAACVKYAYVPIAAGVVLWLCYETWLARKKIAWPKQARNIRQQFKKLSRPFMAIAATGLLLGSIFSAHYIVNYVSYGSFIPDCAVVFDEDACKNYGPWGRNDELKKNLSPDFQPVSFPDYVVNTWLPDMAMRLTFAVAGPTNDYQTKKPIPAVINTFMILTAFGFICFVYRFRQVMSVPIFRLTLIVSMLYILPLIVRLYGAYVATGQPVAINGRYLLPLLPLIGTGLLYAISQTFRKHSRRLPLFALIALVWLIAVGAGITTYALLSEPAWFWI